MKVEVGCPPSKKVSLYLVSDSKRLVSVNKNAILRLAGASEIEFVESGAAAGDKAVSKVCTVGHLFVPLGELVDIEKEKERLQKELDRVISEIARSDGMLMNNNFIAKAPKKLVDAERAKKEKNLDMKRKIEKQLKDLS